MKKRILLLITNFGAGGAQRVFSEQSLFLKERYDVAEAVFDSSETADLYKTGNPQFSLHTKGGRQLLDKIQKLFQRARNLRRLIEQQHTEVCISHMDGANWVNILSRSKAKKIVVVHGTVLHDHHIPSYVNLVRRKWIIPRLYRRADHVVAVSDGIRHELTRYCGLTNVVSIPNGFDMDRIMAKADQPLSSEWTSVFSGSEVLVTSGRLHEQKKQRYLLPVFSKLKARYPQLKLMILGDGELRGSLLKEAQAYGLRCYQVWENDPIQQNYDVYFPGYVENPFPFLKKSTLFLFPSAWEGFPLALCEAMISGVPVLSADCPTGPREILAPGSFDPSYGLQKAESTAYGCLLPMIDKPCFTEVWYEAVLRLLEDKGKRELLIGKGKERMKDFDQRRILERWVDLIEG